MKIQLSQPAVAGTGAELGNISVHLHDAEEIQIVDAVSEVCQFKFNTVM